MSMADQPVGLVAEQGGQDPNRLVRARAWLSVVVTVNSTSRAVVSASRASRRWPVQVRRRESIESDSRNLTSDDQSGSTSMIFPGRLWWLLLTCQASSAPVSAKWVHWCSHIRRSGHAMWDKINKFRS